MECPDTLAALSFRRWQTGLSPVPLAGPSPAGGGGRWGYNLSLSPLIPVLYRRDYGRRRGPGVWARDMQVGIPECSESKLERKKIAHGVSRVETTGSQSPGTWRKIAAAPSSPRRAFRAGLIPTPRGVGYSLSPFRAGEAPLRTRYAQIHANFFGIRNPATSMSRTPSEPMDPAAPAGHGGLRTGNDEASQNQVVVGEGSSYEEALADVKSAIRFHLETFGAEVLPDDSPLSPQRRRGRGEFSRPSRLRGAPGFL